jgi:hypothetical protein
MSKFKVGDRVRIIQRNNSCLRLGSIHSISDFTSDGYVFVKDSRDSGISWCLSDRVLELVQDNKDKKMEDEEKKYKIETGLTIGEAEALILFTRKAIGFQDLHNTLFDIIQEAQRKVVKIGDKEYYEDELYTALSNIKPINSTGE